MKQLYLVIFSAFLSSCGNGLKVKAFELNSLKKDQLGFCDGCEPRLIDEYHFEQGNVGRYYSGEIKLIKFMTLVVSTNESEKISIEDPFDAVALREAKKVGALILERKAKTFGSNVLKGDSSIVGISYNCWTATYADKFVPSHVLEKVMNEELPYSEFWVWIREYHPEIPDDTGLSVLAKYDTKVTRSMRERVAEFRSGRKK